jgi:Vitamin K-dependent gamma-carboxylase
VLLLCLVAFAAGYHARKLHPLIFVLLCYLLGYDVSTVRGYGQLAFYQWLVGYCLPYDQLRDRGGAVFRAPRWGQRLSMLLFSSVYLFSIFAKTHGGEGWFDGRTLYYTLRGHDYGSFLLSARFPVSLGVARVLGWATLLGECFIGLGLWLRFTRPWAVLVCIAMHVTMALSLRVSILFHVLMLGHLPLFLSPLAWERLWGKAREWLPFSALRRMQS